MSGKPWDDNLRNRQFLSDKKHMHRPGAAESKQCKFTRIEAAMDGNLAHCTCHF